MGYAKIDLPDGKYIFISSRAGSELVERKQVYTIPVPRVDVTIHLRADMREWTNGSRAALERVIDEIDQALAHSPVVLVHCDHGRSRSPVAAGAYLIKKYGSSRGVAEDAIKVAFRESQYLHGQLN